MYRLYRTRLESFVNWPIPYICIRTLAASGFYYVPALGLDAVRCFYCNVVLSTFEADDIVDNEHILLSPDCPDMAGIRLTPEPLFNVTRNLNT